MTTRFNTLAAAAATALLCCCLSPTTTTAFVGPTLIARRPVSTETIFQTGKKQHSSLLFSTKEDTNIVTTATANNDPELLRVAQDLTAALEEQDTTPVITTSEEAAVFLADAPLRDDGAYIAEEGASTSDGIFWRGVVVLLCALWASNFACAKIILSQPGVDASLYAVARFSVAALSLLPGSIRAVKKGAISWETAKGALICGSWVAFGYVGQTIGLMTTTPSRSCVICSLNCIFVAIVAEFMRVNSAKGRGFTTTEFNLTKLIPALIAVAGVAIIELKGAAGDPTIGDLISFAQPIGFGMGYLILEDLMHKEPSAALPVSAIKLGVVATAALAFFELSPHAAVDLATNVDADALVEGAKQSMMVGGGFTMPNFTPILQSPLALGAIFYTGIITTSLALWVESIAFQRVPATDASIILTTEPLFAAAISALVVGETFGASDAVGAAFIVGACIYAVKMGESEEVCDEDTKTCELFDK
mmetsp:Transcript_20860/g.29875  ORF Transcript_20860/g.29875 Transcript_20860/m.29875 type:complete len:477 (-) Transcript_20860:122-1552(-)|eukprot:CAMPEP_0201699794 /NCGR_PEP_ID=MMETSP0578-20130828/25496_1 /ASSEMBLY_ACC=CAM_ASM_000663 /TAXON_ID=267565 /ORGANISM="Skeletonema grethea, Strain CCMP 1804" /LENGTH=476 /DNA_ID=CAMNT_0048186649 /DNA_START=39 /DNA_END=1469 /DNA_ORIENTATION=-